MHPRTAKWLWSMVTGTVVATGSASAQFGMPVVASRPRLLPAPCAEPCPPAMPAPSAQPSTRPTSPNIPTPVPEDRPGQPPSTEAQQPSDAPNLGGELAAAVGAASVSVSPNMFGDAFGGTGAIRVVIPNAPIIVPGTPPVRTNLFTNEFVMARFTDPTVFQNAVFLDTGNNNLTSLSVAPFLLNNVIVSNVNPLIFNLTGDGTPNLVENPTVTNSLQAVNPNGQVVFVNGVATFAQATDTFAVQQTYDLITPGTPGQTIARPPLVFVLPSPGGGGLVGRTKISEDNNPLPRDRVIFNYDYFDNVPLTANGFDVRRFSPGFEKTFLDRNASIEVRFPFASTLNADLLADGANGANTQFGNINVTLKALLYGSNTVNVAAGLGISIPTADDVNLGLADGTDLLRINNDALILSPYVAALFTPNDRLFLQTWGAIGFDVNGNAVSAATVVGGGLAGIGRINDPSLLQLDLQVGYWVVSPTRDPSRWFRGLAPFVELHYNSTISDPDQIDLGAFQIVDSLGRFDELNLSAGLLAQIGDNLNVSVGGVAPLRGNNDRFFDYQVGVRVNYFFGATARARQAAIYPSSF